MRLTGSCLAVSLPLSRILCFLGRERPCRPWSLRTSGTRAQLPPPCPPGHVVPSIFPTGLRSSIPLAVLSYTQGTPCFSCLLTSQRHLGDLIHAPCIPYAGRPQSSQCLVYVRTDLKFFSTQTRLVISPNMSLLPYSYSRQWKHPSSCTEIWESSLTPLPSNLQVQLLSESYCPS